MITEEARKRAEEKRNKRDEYVEECRFAWDSRICPRCAGDLEFAFTGVPMVECSSCHKCWGKWLIP